MGNELEVYPSITDEIVNNACQFTDFLASDAVVPVSKKLTIIPDFVKDILDAALQNKQLKIQNIQYMKKAELASEYLKYRNEEALCKYRTEVDVINKQKEIDIARIESNERITVTKTYADYKLAREKQELEKKKFKEILKESNRRFNQRINEVKKLQLEFNALIGVIMNKIANGTAGTNDYDCFHYLCDFKYRLVSESFDISQGFIDMFAKGV